MEERKIDFFDKYLTLWVLLCIVAGIAVGRFLPAVPQTLSQWEYAHVSIPVAILIWVMIYPMMMKVDFQSVKDVAKHPKGLSGNMRGELAHQAIHNVCPRLVFPFLDISKVDSHRLGL